MIFLRCTRIVRVLGMIAGGLVLASLAGQYAVYGFGVAWRNDLVGLFNVGREANLPTLFATVLLLVASMMLKGIAALEKARGRSSRYWTALSAGFLLMAIDEFCALHERATAVSRTWLGGGELGIFYFAWVVPGIALVALIAPLFLRFWWRLPEPARRIFLLAAVIYLGGALGLELIGGYYAEQHTTRNLPYNVLTSVEEALEMAGVLLFLHGMFGYVRRVHGDVVLRIQPARDAE